MGNGLTLTNPHRRTGPVQHENRFMPALVYFPISRSVLSSCLPFSCHQICLRYDQSQVTREGDIPPFDMPAFHHHHQHRIYIRHAPWLRGDVRWGRVGRGRGEGGQATHWWPRITQIRLFSARKSQTSCHHRQTSSPFACH